MTHTRLLPALALAVSLMALPQAGMAHPGHDDAPEPVATTGSPRTEAHSDDFELVAIAAGPHTLTIWLDRFATNEPLSGGSVDVADGQVRQPGPSRRRTGPTCSARPGSTCPASTT